MKIQNINYQNLIAEIGNLLESSRQKASQSVNIILVKTYWNIGRYIVEFEQNGNEKSEYGSNLLDKLSKDLSLSYGKGFSRSNLFQI